MTINHKLLKQFQKLALTFFKRHFTKTHLEIYTDGSSKNGWGAWAFVISKRGKCLTEKSGRVRHANSNDMEFQAAIEALQAIPKKSRITLFSDSRILIDTMKWGNGPIAHQTQIEALEHLDQKHFITWQWVKAHNGVKFNERCDELCTLAREGSIQTSCFVIPPFDAIFQLHRERMSPDSSTQEECLE